jgi:hypothetical protein
MVASFENLVNRYPEAQNAHRGLQPQISPLHLPAIEVPWATSLFRVRASALQMLVIPLEELNRICHHPRPLHLSHPARICLSHACIH